MNYEPMPHAHLTRCGLALAAMLVTTLLASGIDGLAKHYSAYSTQAALSSVASLSVLSGVASRADRDCAALAQAQQAQALLSAARSGVVQR